MPVLIYQLRAVALVILCLVAGTAWAADPDVRGIDVSDNNGRVDWNQVKKDGLVFSFIKATDGISYPEVWYFNENWPKMKAAGIVRGAFHYYEPSNDPIEQANYFADTLLKAGFEDGDMPPVLDIELDGGLGTAITGKILLFLEQLEKRTKRTPIIYVSPGFADPYFNDSALAKYPLWLADYTDGPPQLPRIWKEAGKKFTFWQYSSKGYRNGLQGSRVDLDVFLGTGPQLSEFIASSHIGGEKRTAQKNAKVAEAKPVKPKPKPAAKPKQTAEAKSAKVVQTKSSLAASGAPLDKDEVEVNVDGITLRVGSEISAQRIAEIVKALQQNK